MIEVTRGDVVLVAFPFITRGEVERKRRPAVIVQADRYNKRRTAAMITSTRAHQDLPCKVLVTKDSPAGRRARIRLDSVVDCQMLATIPREEIVRRLGAFPAETVQRIDLALQDALELTHSRP